MKLMVVGRSEKHLHQFLLFLEIIAFINLQKPTLVLTSQAVRRVFYNLRFFVTFS